MSVTDRRTREKAGLRREILDAARDMFVREGYDSVSMRKIAERVEYAPGTIYLYFKDKSEILDTLCRETFQKLQLRMQAIQKDPGNPLEGLRRGLRAYVQFGLDNPNEYIVTFVLAKGKVDMDQCSARQSGMACFDCLSQIVRQCIEGGFINGGGAEETAQALWASIHGLTSLLAMNCGFPFVEQSRLIERQLDILIKGIQVHRE